MTDEVTIGFSPEEQSSPMRAARDFAGSFAGAAASGSAMSIAFTNRADGSVSEGTGFFENLGQEQRPALDKTMEVAATHVVPPTVS